MAETAALARARSTMVMTGWVASPLISKFINEGLFYPEIDMAARINKLEATILPQFQEVIDAAEKSEHKSNLEKWLRRFKEAMYEAKDVLDLYKYRLLQQKVENGGTTTKTSLDKFTSFCYLSIENIKQRKCLNKLEKIVLEANEFRGLLGRQVKSNLNNSIREPLMTTSRSPSCIFGRDVDCAYLVQQLLEPITFKPESSKAKSYKIHSIVGIGGAGKTTLAQLVYNNARITDEFDHRIWLSMTRGLDLYRDTQIMVEAVLEYKCPRFESLDKLQEVLTNSIKSKKILVMMDDVWWDETMDEETWRLFVSPLENSKRGSKIIVTSRTEKMPRALLPRKIMLLKQLEETHFLSLFMHHAFDGLELNSILSQKLETIGKQIATKLSRSPLAAKAVGSRLFKNPNEQFWRDTLETDMLTDTMQSLLWSYQNLDASIQRCFSYCAIFPKGHRFFKKNLILLWVAEGFVHPSKRTVEDEGEDYFRELVSVFFFDYHGSTYSMHDLFHDLAERVSQEDCFRIEDGQLREIPSLVRHLSIQGETFTNYIMRVEKLKYLCTVIFIDPVSDNVINSFLTKIHKFSKLRVLELCPCTINKIPNDVGELVLLRYLGLGETLVADLPTSIEKLYNLQTLKMDDIITNLPRGLNKLINLRHLMTTVNSTLPEIGQLRSLQELCSFEVMNEKGYEIAQLKHLNEIRGSLEILGLSNIRSTEEATKANMKDKKHLERLSFIWHHDCDICENLNVHLEVLEGLKPHKNLKDLNIRGYESPMFPSWMVQQESIDYLSSLTLEDCPNIEVLPPINTLFPCLATITINNLPKLTKLPVFPSSLKELCINYCFSLVFIYNKELHNRSYEARLLEVLHENKEKYVMDKNIHMITVTMNYIYRMKEKYPLIVPLDLQRLRIANCYITDEALKHCLVQLTCLESLELDAIRLIISLPSKEFLHQLMMLKCLKISNCDLLSSLGDLHALVSIRNLSITRCLSLKIPGEGGIGTLPHSLVVLSLIECHTLTHFELNGLQSLSSASFKSCQLLKSMVLTNLPSLKTLEIINCTRILKLTCSNVVVLDRLVVKECYNLQHIFSSDVPAWTSLKEIVIGRFSMLIEFLSKDRLVNLNTLTIENSNEASFNEDEFGCLTSLWYFYLNDCKVEALPCSMKKLSSLRSINLCNCDELQSLPNMPETIQYLFLKNCHAIASLPVLPKFLRKLEIIDCPNLSTRCQEPDGEDWPKISHVWWRDIK